MTTKTETPHDDTRAKIMKLLRAAEGDAITARIPSIKLKTGEAAIKHIAEHMIDAGAIRKIMETKRTTSYYAPTERQLAAEEKARQAIIHKPLQPRTAHAEAVARAKAVRE